MMLTSHKFGWGKYLALQRVDTTKASAPPPAPPSIDHLAVVDVSGSMGGDLPLVRELLKQRIIKSVLPGDTFTLIWFSGRGEHGALLTAETLSGLRDVKQVFDVIDRYLQPVGMTGFQGPLEDCDKVLQDLRKKRPEALANLIFMSDGCDNQSTHDQIFQALDKLYGRVHAATFVEYGYYADRRLLTRMAEKLGGSVVCAEDFPSFQPVLEHAVQTASPSRSYVTLEAPGCTDFVFGVHGGDVVVYAVENGCARVPSDPATGAPAFDLAWVTSDAVGLPAKDLSEAIESDRALRNAAFAALSAYGHRMRGDIVKELLLTVRDVDLLDRFSRCFGKQRYSEFADLAKKVVETGIFRRASDASMYFRTDLPTMLDLFDLLAVWDATAMVEHGAFKYDRITKKMVDADPNGPVFKADKAEGAPISGIVLNKDRPNISMRLQKFGTLNLRNVKDRPRGIPDELRAFQWRNYALVADGIVHIDLLPVRLKAEHFQKMRETLMFKRLEETGVFRGISDEGDEFGLMLDLTRVGLTNEQTSARPSGEALADLEVALLLSQCEQKVYNHYAKLYTDKPTVDPALAMAFGPDQAKWLAEKGLSGGCFSPKRKAEVAKDVYQAVELQTKIKSFSSLPSVQEIQGRLASGKKLTPAMEVMAPLVEGLEKKLKTSKNFGKLVSGEASARVAATRDLLFDVASMKFGIVLGQTWFHEAKDPGVYKTSVVKEGRTFEVEIALADVLVEV